MSETDRAELRRLLEEAYSKLPWGMGTEEGYDYGIIYGAPYEREGGGYLLIPTVADPSYGEDAALITAAVNALPGLLDALEKAEAHRDSLAATLIEVQREKLALERVINRVRELHAPTGVDALQYDCAAEECEHEYGCPTIEMTVCKGCYDLGERIDVYGYERGGVEHVLYPCPTVQALDGGGSDE